jgi:aryl carrier-like protein
MVYDNDVKFHLGYWDSALSDSEAKHLADLLNSTLVNIMEDIERPVGSLDNVPEKSNSASSGVSSNIYTPQVKSGTSGNIIKEITQQTYPAEMRDFDKGQLSGKEEALRQAWIDVLEVNPDAVTRTTSLRSLGVDSYLAIQIVRRVQDFGLELKFADALSGMTLATMAARLTPAVFARSDASQSSFAVTTLLSPIGNSNSSSASTDHFDNHSSSTDNDAHSGKATPSDSQSSTSAKDLVSAQASAEKIPSGVLIELTAGKLPLATVVIDPVHSAAAESADEPGGAATPPCHSFELCWETIEDLVPATPVQAAMLESQQRLLTPNLYVPRAIWRVNGLTKAAGSQTLIQAWQRVVDTHACLRTVFVRTVTDSDFRYSQLVLKSVDTCVQHLEAKSEQDALKLLADHTPAATAFRSEKGLRPAHVLTLCHITGSDEDDTADDQFIFDLSINHALSDAVSSAVILRQLATICGSAAGDSKTSITLPTITPYSDIQRSQDLLGDSSRSKGKEYWASYLDNAEPCHFPSGVNTSATPLGKVGKVSVHFERSSELRDYTMATGITASTFFRTAWAMLLAKWLGRTDVCFGYVVSGRDASVPGIEEIVGPVLNILPCRANVTSARNRTRYQDTSEKKDAIELEMLLDKIQTDLFESLPHQLNSSTFVDNSTSPGTSMFNTLVNFRNSGLSRISKTERTTPGDHTTMGTESVFSKIEDFEVLWYEDPMEVSFLFVLFFSKHFPIFSNVYKTIFILHICYQWRWNNLTNSFLYFSSTSF